MSSKDDEARELAQKHYQIEDGITQIFRVTQSAELEADPNAPIILLEANTNTIPSGVMPIRFGPEPDIGIHYPSVIVEVTPEEFQRIQAQGLELPAGWRLAELIPRQFESAER